MKKTVLITGASCGIGAEIARKFYNKGYNVAINYNRSEEKAKELSKELKGSIIIKGDVSCEKDVCDMVKAVVAAFGRIDVLVNNAGISSFNLLTDISGEEWDKIFSVINISSIWGISGASCESCYSASKGAVISFTKSLAKELGPSGICVNSVAPGFIDTDMNKNISIEDKEAFKDETPLLKIGNKADVANAVLFLASEEADFITGQILTVDGGVII